METRLMTWDVEGFLANELHWLSIGHGSRSLTEEERLEAAQAFEIVVEQSHDEPEHADDEDDEPVFEITLPVDAWAAIDRLLANVDLGDGIGIVGQRPGETLIPKSAEQRAHLDQVHE